MMQKNRNLTDNFEDKSLKKRSKIQFGSTSRKKPQRKPYFTISTFIAIIIISALMILVTVITPAHALTHYYNCIARVVKKNATLTISNVDACYNMIFKGALDYYGIKQSPITSHNSTNPQENLKSESGKNQTDNKIQIKVPESLQNHGIFDSRSGS